MQQAPGILQVLQGKFGSKILSSDMSVLDPTITVEGDSIAEICSFLKSNEALAFDTLMCLSAVDYKGLKGETDRIELVYHLFSMKHRHQIVLKVLLPREEPSIPSVEQIWDIANWHEREAYDMFGVTFNGHTDLRRILCPDDWVGYPLRKDYVQPETYRGMPVAPGKQFVEMAQDGLQVGTDPFREG
ncbi:MAG TPA: NADH-quinone oxidoreductase subunit C [Terriglobia bacterium]|nr:NADH-quinone oxidoreductase subunit C [Terriglobia bacterium]